MTIPYATTMPASAASSAVTRGRGSTGVEVTLARWITSRRPMAEALMARATDIDCCCCARRLMSPSISLWRVGSPSACNDLI